MKNDFKDQHTAESEGQDQAAAKLTVNIKGLHQTDSTSTVDVEKQVENNMALLRQMVAEQEGTRSQAEVDQIPDQEQAEPEEEFLSREADSHLDQGDLDATRVFAEAPLAQTDPVAASRDLEETKRLQPISHSESDTNQVEEEAVVKSRTKHHQTRKKEKKRRSKKERTSRRITRFVLLFFLLAILGGGFYAWNYVSTSLGPVNSQATQYVQVEIPEGSSTSSIAKILKNAGLIKDANIFTLYTKIKSYNNFQSGYYHLKQSMTVEEIARSLQEKGSEVQGQPVLGRVRVIEGYTIQQIADSLSDNVMTEDTGDKTPYNKEDFLKLMKDETFIKKMQEKYPKLLSSLPAANSGVVYRLEGYLYPATYDYHEGESLEDLVDGMIATLDTNMKDYYSKIEQSGYSVNDILTLASLVEKEGVRDDDRRNIASVFYNRLAANMPLQSNVALHYAAGNLGKDTTIAQDAAVDTNMNSPYNIYKNTGLMPGPVDSPSIDAIKWTIEPNKSDYLYFVADMKSKNKEIYFAKTLAEHEKNVQEHVNAYIQK